MPLDNEARYRQDDDGTLKDERSLSNPGWGSCVPSSVSVYSCPFHCVLVANFESSKG